MHQRLRILGGLFDVVKQGVPGEGGKLERLQSQIIHKRQYRQSLNLLRAVENLGNESLKGGQSDGQGLITCIFVRHLCNF